MKNVGVFFGIMILLAGCKSTTKTMDLQVERLLTGGTFEVVQRVANPLTSNELNQLGNVGLFEPGSWGGSINISGNVNYMRFYGDSVSVELPYYGTRRGGNVIGSSDNGISFTQAPTDVVITTDERKGRKNIAFTAKSGSESYDVIIIVFANGNTTTNVIGTFRTAIRYEGRVGAIRKVGSW